MRFPFLRASFLITLVLCILTSGSQTRAQTTRPGTLVIVKAVYGDLPDGDKTDVTDKVKAMVKDSALRVDATNDNFGDPAVGIGKKLQVDYTIDGVAHSKSVDENETLSIGGGRITIIKAVWGDLPDGDKTDVTTKVADKLGGDTLSIDASNDNFGDPAVGVGKKLQVEYTIDGVKKTKIVKEDQKLIITTAPSKLVITKAMYGDLPDGDKTDVTKIVTDQINGDSLSIDATNDNFGDPANGVAKQLKVDYTLDGAAGSKTVSEGETLTIPEGK